MKVILTDEQQVPVRVAFKTAAGNPAKVDGVPSWNTSNSDVLELVPEEDGMGALVKTRGPLGGAQVSVVADADLGEGVREVTAVLDVDVQAAEAVSASIEAGTPEIKP